jgi:hypothetical protein
VTKVDIDQIEAVTILATTFVIGSLLEVLEEAASSLPDDFVQSYNAIVMATQVFEGDMQHNKHRYVNEEEEPTLN